jgi:hypothetical protein
VNGPGFPEMMKAVKQASMVSKVSETPQIFQKEDGLAYPGQIRPGTFGCLEGVVVVRGFSMTSGSLSRQRVNGPGSQGLT